MLALAEIRPDDVLYDLGCGTGGIVIAAARRYGIHCVSVELDGRLLRRARKDARRAGVGRLVQFVRQDAKTVDVTRATVVTLYLVQTGVLKLEQKLRAELRPGARVISRDSPMGGWPPEKVLDIPGEPATTLYRWTVVEPAEKSVAAGSRVPPVSARVAVS